MNKKIIGLAVLVAVGFASCLFMKQKPNSESMPGVAELRYDLWGQGMFWLPDLPRLSAIEMIRWIGNRNLPKLKIMNY
jgi:hypothetical protein